MADLNFLVSGETVADALGVTRRRIDQLIQQGHLPATECRPKRGSYDFFKCTKYYIEFLKNEGALSKAVDETSTIDPREERALLHQQQRIKLELENATTKRELLDANEVTTLLESLQTIYNNHIDALEGRLTGQITAATQTDASLIIGVVRPELVAIRTEVADAIKTLANSYAPSENS